MTLNFIQKYAPPGLLLSEKISKFSSPLTTLGKKGYDSVQIFARVNGPKRQHTITSTELPHYRITGFCVLSRHHHHGKNDFSRLGWPKSRNESLITSFSLPLLFLLLFSPFPLLLLLFPSPNSFIDGNYIGDTATYCLQ